MKVFVKILWICGVIAKPLMVNIVAFTKAVDSLIRKACLQSVEQQQMNKNVLEILIDFDVRPSLPYINAKKDFPKMF